MMKKSKLTTKDRIKIAFSIDKSTRELAKEFNVHHSVIAEIKKEAQTMLKEYWEEKSKRIGRPTKKDEIDPGLTGIKNKLKEKQKEADLKTMRIDYLELQLKWRDRLIAEVNAKKNLHLKKKEKIELIMLAKRHKRYFSYINKQKRLGCNNMTIKAYVNMKKSIKERIRRETSIPGEDIEEAIKQIIHFPFLGSRKGILTLLKNKKALLGETFYKEIKNQLKYLSEIEYAKRKEESELEKNKIKRRKKPEEFIKVESRHVNDIWAIDYVQMMVFGIVFYICVVYDLYSQGYMAIEIGEEPSFELAKQAIEKACIYSGTKAKRYILSDNGKQFCCYSYDNLLKLLGMADKKIPPGKPWFNGALESGNRDLKKTLFTIIAYKACNYTEITQPGKNRKDILYFLINCCALAMRQINNDIVRPKFCTTPIDVMQNKIEIKQNEMRIFKKIKQAERKKRMEDIKTGKIKRKNMSFADIVKVKWKKIVSALSTDKIYAFTELIYNRYQFLQA